MSQTSSTPMQNLNKEELRKRAESLLATCDVAIARVNDTHKRTLEVLGVLGRDRAKLLETLERLK